MAKGKVMIDIWWGELERRGPEEFTVYHVPALVVYHEEAFETNPDIVRKAEAWAGGMTFTTDQVRVLKWYRPRLMETVEATEPAP